MKIKGWPIMRNGSSAIIFFIILIAPLALLSCQATAITPLGSISGHVTTTNGDIVAGCTIQLYNSSGSTVATTTTDSTGHYTLSPPAGTYTIQAYKVGVVGNYMGTVGAPIGKFVTRDITLVPIPSKFKLTQTKSTIYAEGFDYTILNAQITDAWGKLIIDCPVVFDIKTSPGYISPTSSKQTLSLVTISPDAAGNYKAYYGWVPKSSSGGQATITVSGSQAGTGAKFTYYFYVNVDTGPTPTPFAVSITPVPVTATPDPADDNTAPVTTASFDGQYAGASGVFGSDVVITLTATDNGGSGIARTEYSLGSMTWTPYDGPFTMNKDGMTTVYYRSVDNGGNIEATKTVMVNIVRPTATTSTESVNTVTATPAAIETATPVPATPTPSASAVGAKQSKVPCVVFAILPLVAVGIMTIANKRKGGK
jgi:hypothetical protein